MHNSVCVGHNHVPMIEHFNLKVTRVLVSIKHRASVCDRASNTHFVRIPNWKQLCSQRPPCRDFSGRCDCAIALPIALHVSLSAHVTDLVGVFIAPTIKLSLRIGKRY